MIWTKITLKVTSCIDAICIYAELKCFTAHIVLNGETRYLASIDELGMAGVFAHRKLGVLICLGCNSCCLPNNMVWHEMPFGCHSTNRSIEHMPNSRRHYSGKNVIILNCLINAQTYNVCPGLTRIVNTLNLLGMASKSGNNLSRME